MKFLVVGRTFPLPKKKVYFQLEAREFSLDFYKSPYLDKKRS